jgi:hypothetical protein
MKAWITTTVAIGIAIASAAPAAATDDEYVKLLQDRFPFLSADQLLTEGHRTCQLIQQGRPGVQAVAMVQNDLKVSASAANQIVATAVMEFGC